MTPNKSKAIPSSSRQRLKLPTIPSLRFNLQDKKSKSKRNDVEQQVSEQAQQSQAPQSAPLRQRAKAAAGAGVRSLFQRASSKRNAQKNQQQPSSPYGKFPQRGLQGISKMSSMPKLSHLSFEPEEHPEPAPKSRGFDKMSSMPKLSQLTGPEEAPSARGLGKMPSMPKMSHILGPLEEPEPAPSSRGLGKMSSTPKLANHLGPIEDREPAPSDRGFGKMSSMPKMSHLLGPEEHFDPVQPEPAPSARGFGKMSSMPKLSTIMYHDESDHKDEEDVALYAVPKSPVQVSKTKLTAKEKAQDFSIESAMANSPIRRGGGGLAVQWTPPPPTMVKASSARQMGTSHSTGRPSIASSLPKSSSARQMKAGAPSSPLSKMKKKARFSSGITPMTSIEEAMAQSPIRRGGGGGGIAVQWAPVPPSMDRAVSAKQLSSSAHAKNVNINNSQHGPRMDKASSARQLQSSPTSTKTRPMTSIASALADSRNQRNYTDDTDEVDIVQWSTEPAMQTSHQKAVPLSPTVGFSPKHSSKSPLPALFSSQFLEHQDHRDIPAADLTCVELICSDDEERPGVDEMVPPRSRISKQSAKESMVKGLTREAAVPLMGAPASPLSNIKAGSIRNLAGQQSPIQSLGSSRNATTQQEPRHNHAQSFERMTAMPAFSDLPAHTHACVEIVSDDEDFGQPRTPSRGKKPSVQARPPKSPTRITQNNGAPSSPRNQRSSSKKNVNSNSAHGSASPIRGESKRKLKTNSPKKSPTRTSASPRSSKQSLGKLAAMPGPPLACLEVGSVFDEKGSVTGTTKSMSSLSDLDNSNSTDSFLPATSYTLASPKTHTNCNVLTRSSHNPMESPRLDRPKLDSAPTSPTRSQSIDFDGLNQSSSSSSRSFSDSDGDTVPSQFSLTYNSQVHTSPRNLRSTVNGNKNFSKLKHAMKQMNSGAGVDPLVPEKSDATPEKSFVKSTNDNGRDVQAKSSSPPHRTDSAYLSSLVKDFQQGVVDVNTLDCFATNPEDAPVILGSSAPRRTDSAYLSSVVTSMQAGLVDVDTMEFFVNPNE